MWGEDGVSHGDIWFCLDGLVEDHKQFGSHHPPNSGLLPPDDELPVDLKQEECTEDSMVTDLFLDSDTTIEDLRLDFSNSSGSQTVAAESSNDVTKEYVEGGSHDKEHTHSGEKNYARKECGKGFSVSGYLEKHMLTHSGEKPFICKECGAGFSMNTRLKRHMLTHSAEKPFICKECGSAFLTANNLKTHMRTHTGEKPFTCKECGAAFSHGSNLKKHMRSHTGEKPFTCKECGAAFSQGGNLKTHMRTHT